MEPIVDITSLSTVELIRVIQMRPPQWSLFTTLFKQQPASDKEVFEVHTVVRGQNAIPVVSNYSPGVLRQPEGWEIAQVKAPRFRTKREFRAADLIHTRQPGYTNYDTQPDPFQIALAYDLDKHRADHDYMLEIMCAQACVDARVVLYGLDNGVTSAKQIIDFKRPASHVKNITNANNKWSKPDSDLIAQIEDGHRLIMEDCNGMAATELIMGYKAWNAFRKHNDVKESIDTTYRYANGGTIDRRINALNRGQWNGINLWVYNGWYLDVDGTKKYYIDENAALLITRQADNVIQYARPVDLDCSGPTDYFVKAYKQDDPSGQFTVAESRPLPICFYPAWSVLYKNVSA